MTAGYASFALYELPSTTIELECGASAYHIHEPHSYIDDKKQLPLNRENWKHSRRGYGGRAM